MVSLGCLSLLFATFLVHCIANPPAFRGNSANGNIVEVKRAANEQNISNKNKTTKGEYKTSEVKNNNNAGNVKNVKKQQKSAKQAETPNENVKSTQQKRDKSKQQKENDEGKVSKQKVLDIQHGKMQSDNKKTKNTQQKNDGIKLQNDKSKGNGKAAANANKNVKTANANGKTVDENGVAKKNAKSVNNGENEGKKAKAAKQEGRLKAGEKKQKAGKRRYRIGHAQSNEYAEDMHGDMREEYINEPPPPQEDISEHPQEVINEPPEEDGQDRAADRYYGDTYKSQQQRVNSEPENRPHGHHPQQRRMQPEEENPWSPEERLNSVSHCLMKDFVEEYNSFDAFGEDYGEPIYQEIKCSQISFQGSSQCCQSLPVDLFPSTVVRKCIQLQGISPRQIASITSLFDYMLNIGQQRDNSLDFDSENSQTVLALHRETFITPGGTLNLIEGATYFQSILGPNWSYMGHEIVYRCDYWIKNNFDISKPSLFQPKCLTKALLMIECIKKELFMI